MFSYVMRRLGVSLLVLLGASFLVYMLVAVSGDPLQEFRETTKPNKDQLIAQRVALLNLDVPAPVRYFIWLGGAVKCVIPGQCDLGVTLQGQPVTTALSTAIPSTLQLVTGATLIAIVVGVIVGIVTALRQYSALDYSVTFVAFLFFSLPVFWVAVLLKEFGAIRFNDFLANPVVPPMAMVLVGVVSAVIWPLILGGSWRRRGITALVAGVVGAGVLFYLGATEWFSYPGLGPVLIALTGVGIAIAITALLAGLANRQALYASLTTVALAVAAMYALAPLLEQATLWLIVLLGLAAIGAGVLAGYLFGGYDRRQSMKAAGLTSFLVAGLVLLDRFMQSWPAYFTATRGRPIATIGSETPNLNGDFWTTGLYMFTHLVLPTTALVLISVASYTRYSRASMLEVMGQDYVRTARAKGLSERVVVTRHAFRNALIPLATVVAFDIGQLLGGAVITENVFSFKGMGALFVTGLYHQDPNPVMGTFLVVGITAVTFNLLADLAYSALDPRVRVKA
ncbi:MAG: ABC transporter permease [Cellulomonas sp.]|nr:ABC transporter permease [Cellulomonas sp.]